MHYVCDVKVSKIAGANKKTFYVKKNGLMNRSTNRT